MTKENLFGNPKVKLVVLQEDEKPMRILIWDEFIELSKSNADYESIDYDKALEQWCDDWSERTRL